LSLIRPSAFRRVHYLVSLILHPFPYIVLLFFFFLMIRPPPISTLFPTRRSSDLARAVVVFFERLFLQVFEPQISVEILADQVERDRKSTRLNSSHVAISYAVFCLKKKKNNKSNIDKDVSKREKIACRLCVYAHLT